MKRKRVRVEGEGLEGDRGGGSHITCILSICNTYFKTEGGVGEPTSHTTCK